MPWKESGRRSFGESLSADKWNRPVSSWQENVWDGVRKAMKALRPLLVGIWRTFALAVIFLLVICLLVTQSAPAQAPAPTDIVTKKQPTEIVLTELQSSRLELALQREIGAAKDLELLRFQFEKRQKDYETLKAASGAAFDALCKEIGLDPARSKPSADLKKITEAPKENK